MDQKEALIREFGATLGNDPPALAECVRLLQMYSLSPEQLSAKWEAYLSRIGSLDETSMSGLHLESFKSQLQRERDQQAQQSNFATPRKATVKLKSQNHSPAVGRSSAFGMDSFDVPMRTPEKVTPGGFTTTPSYNIRSDVFSSPIMASSPVMASPSSRTFADRKSRAEVIETFNPHLQLRKEAPLPYSVRPGQQRCIVKPITVVNPYRFMHEKISEKSEALDDRIDIFAKLYKEANPGTTFNNPAYLGQSTILAIGRICSDSNEGKINEESLMLETNRTIGGGARIRLNLKAVVSYNLFAGQIVVMEGINSTGLEFVVEKIYEMPFLPMAGTNPSELEALHYQTMGGQPTKVMAASGPYTLNDNLRFEPFQELMSKVEKERPDVLLLQGPFISSEHPLVVSGDVDMMPEEYFARFFSARLEQYQNSYPNEMQVVLVPSLQDIITEQMVMPQPGLEARKLGLSVGTLCLSNPGQFSINEVVFAVNSTDVVMNLGADEIVKQALRSDRLGRLARYLIEQRSMYPCYPGPLNSGSNAVDFNQYDLLDLKITPDIMILPGSLTHFSKKVDDVVVLNPGKLAKGNNAGTYAILTIHPYSKNTLEDALMMVDDDIPGVDSTSVIYNRATERCRVDIVRI